MSEPALPDKVVAVGRGLDAARIRHAFGGALALAYYAEPRATIDVDVNLFCPPGEHARVRSALDPLGVDWNVDLIALERDGQCRVWWGRTPIDLFFAYDPFHEAMKRSLRRVPFGEETIPILSPEHLLVCKAVFDRAKDWLDIEQVLAANDDLDMGEVRRWVDRVVGASDPRSRRFEQLATRS